jgi:TonB family protein
MWWAGIGEGPTKAMLALCLVLATGAGARAQTPMEIAAAQLAGPILHSRQKTVAVFDFSGPGNKVTELGGKLADDFSAAIAKASGEIQVKDRSTIEEKRRENFYAPDIVLDPPSVLVFANELGAKAFVIGEMSEGQGNTLSIDLRVYRASNGKGISGIRVSFPLTKEMTELLGKNISIFNLPADFSNFPKGGVAGYSAPTCVYCPRADYSPEATRERLQGVVELGAIVGADGLIKELAVLKGLPGGLNASAIQAVKGWRLKPATGPDGKPCAVRQVIEVEFRLF